MKITRQTGTELVVEDGTLWIAAVCLLGSLPLLGMGIVHGHLRLIAEAFPWWLFAVVWLRRTRVCFDRTQGTVAWQRLRYFRRASGSLPLSRLSAINIETSLAGRGGANTYRLALATPEGSFPFSDEYSGGRMRCERVRESILEFLTAGAGGGRVLTEGSESASAGDSSNSEETESSVRALVAQGRRIEAIELLRRSGMSLGEAVTRVNQIAAAIRPE